MADRRLELLSAVQDPDAAARLLDEGCDPNGAHPQYGSTPLYNACFMDRVDSVRLLLARGADPNQRITYRSPVDGRVETGVVALMLAHSTAAIDALLEAGADPHAVDGDGQTVLKRCVLTTPLDGLERLMRTGVDPAARDRHGLSAADVVRARLDWYRKFAKSIDQTKAQPRIAHLEAILRLLARS